MWKQKLGMSVSDKFGIPAKTVLKMLADTGFDAVSPLKRRNDTDLASTVSAAREYSLVLQSLHAPFHRVNGFWKDDEDTVTAMTEHLAAIEDCARYEIPVLVCHAWIGFKDIIEPQEKHLEKIQSLVSRAKTLGVKLAFENTEGEEHLKMILDNFKGDDTVGFCWDSGHEMCYNHSQDMLALYGDRLYMTHLNDNLGIKAFDGTITCNDDLHLLPFDGIGDWDDAAKRLKRSKKQDIINFELKTDFETEADAKAYFTECYKRACRIAAKLINA